MLERRPLGSTGLDLSVVGVGGGGLPSNDAEAKDVVEAFFKGGANFVDTSPGYGGGTSEKKLGMALANTPRSSYILQSKMGDAGQQNGGHSPFSRQGVLASVEHSLKMLKTDFVDSLLLHDPYSDELDAFLAKGGGMEAVRELKSAGIVRHFGCGAREHEPHVKLLEALGPSEYQISQSVDDDNPLRRFLDQLDLKAKCQAANVGIINAAPLYRGLLVDAPTAYHSIARGSAGATPGHAAVLGEHTASHQELAALAASMGEWTRGQGIPLLHLAVRWPIEACPHITCSPYGCGTVAQVEGVLKHATTPLPEAVLDRFDAEFGHRVAALGPEKHFYWFKKQTLATKEWDEMSAYPRATWGHAFVERGH